MLHCNPRLVNNKLYTLGLNHNDSMKIFFVCQKMTFSEGNSADSAQKGRKIYGGTLF